MKQVYQRISRLSVQSVVDTIERRLVLTKSKPFNMAPFERMVRNTAYFGRTYFGVTSRMNKSKTVIHPADEWILLENTTPAVISEELFRQANAQLDKPKVRTGRPKHEYLLKNHAFCAICGKPLVGHCLNKKYLYYQCSNARPHENSGNKCQARYLRAGDLEKTVWDKTQPVLADPDIILA